jgi:hypothetical protein
MKHLLNNLTEEEKNSIRRQHTGGMNVVTENFSKLINTKSGDVKLFLNEQTSSNDPLIQKGYQLVEINSLPNGQQKDRLLQLIKKYPTYKYYVKGNVKLISDGKMVIFVVSPERWKYGVGPFPIEKLDDRYDSSI